MSAITNEIFESFRNDQKKIKEAKDFLKSKGEVPEEKVLEWFNNFVDHIQSNNSNLYNEACKYADQREEECDGI